VEAKVNKSRKLELRMMDFAMAVISLTKMTPKTTENQIINKQLIRSASSVGANYTEANNAASRQDFRNKIYIAKKEAAETRYWLHLLSRTNPKANTDRLIDESTQLILILQKVITTLRNGK